jgi:hypothetical protein
MALKLKRYKDGTYTPLMKPWARRVDFGNVPKKKGKVARYVDKAIDRTLSPY